MTKLVLGSVQFGINYGISNQHGKTKFSAIHVTEMCEIISSVIDRNICSDIID